MNSSRSSSLVVLILALVLAVGAAGAVTVSQADAPSEGQVGTDLEGRFVLNDLYTDYDEWTLRGETELVDVTWTVEVFNQAGDKMGGDHTYDGQVFNHSVDIDTGAAEIRISMTGTVPAIANYTYDPAETFLFGAFTLDRQNGTSETIETYRTHHYTEDSRAARGAMDAAREAINATGGHQQAERTLESAVSAYENENFDNAVDLANQAEETAKQKRSTQSRNRLILMAIGAIIVVGVVVGAVVYWRRTRTQSRL